MRLSDVADELWDKLAKSKGTSRQSIIEEALRVMARRDGIPVPGDEEIGLAWLQRQNSNLAGATR